MKNWNTPEIMSLSIEETTNGTPWFHEEYVDCVAGLINYLFDTNITTLGEVPTKGDQGDNKGENEETSGTGDSTNSLS